jgi:two-component system response regulator FixJ
MASDEPARVHVIDDDPALRDSLKFLFASEGVKVETHESAQAFLDRMDSLAIGCVVTDVRMPGMSGLELVRRLRALKLEAPVIVMTGHGDIALAVEAMKAGAHDFIEKPFDDETLLSAVRNAIEPLPAEDDSEASTVRRRIAQLSMRERQVLEGLIEGQANKVIAMNLGISPRTVEIYRAKVMTKMGAHSFAELIRLAMVGGVSTSQDGAS